MKRLLRCVAVILSLTIVFACPANAAETSTYASRYFDCYGAYIHVVEDNHMQIWFSVGGTAIMQRIGVSEIIIKRSSDGKNWSSVYYYYPEDNSSMMDYNSGNHNSYVPFYGTHGYYYKAYVTFHAKDSSGVGEASMYTEPVYIPVQN